MDRFNPLAIPISPVTKGWVFAVVALAVATSMELVSPAKLVFSSSRVFTEPWRLITGFCFFGPLSLMSLEYILVMSRTINSLESDYIYPVHRMPQGWISCLDKESKKELYEVTEAQKTMDFAYFVGETSLLIVSTIYISSRWCGFATNFFYLGPVLQDVLVYIDCKRNPEKNMVMLGIRAKAKYVPFLKYFLVYLFSEGFKLFSENINNGFVVALKYFITSKDAKQILLVVLLSHTWWFINFFYLSSVYNELDSQAEQWNISYRRLQAQRTMLLSVPELWRYLVTPPWYYFTVRNLLKEQLKEQERYKYLQSTSKHEPEHVSNTRNQCEVVEQDEEIELVDSLEGSSGINTNESVIAGPRIEQ